jgi:hypothetical protein
MLCFRFPSSPATRQSTLASKDKKRTPEAFAERANRLIFAFTATAALALSTGCATAPPVQEMSDARQAIAAAEEADAAERAPDSLDDARRFLETAEELLRNEAYGPARVNAVRAKNRAVQALEASQRAAEEEGD